MGEKLLTEGEPEAKQLLKAEGWKLLQLGVKTEAEEENCADWSGDWTDAKDTEDWHEGLVLAADTRWTEMGAGVSVATPTHTTGTGTGVGLSMTTSTHGTGIDVGAECFPEAKLKVLVLTVSKNSLHQA